MLSKNHTKFIQSLHLKKNRESEGLFIAEGRKITAEILASGWPVSELLASEKFIKEQVSFLNAGNIKVTTVSEEELKKISMLQRPDDGFLICKIPSAKPVYTKIQNSLILYLDGIRDPGNLGTIVRICDWFGIETVFCSPDCTELYNPKTIQASMGSFLRVKVFYDELENILSAYSSAGIKMPVYGAFLEGQNVYAMKSWESGILVIGSEANGISEKNENLAIKKISIPSFGSRSAESLNAAVATSVLVAEFRRKNSEFNG